MKRWLYAACVVGACSRGEPTSTSTAQATVAASATGDPSAIERRSPATLPTGPVEQAASGAAPSPTAAMPPAMPSALAKPGSTLTVGASGVTSGLRLASDSLLFCDKRGGRAIDLTSGAETAHEHPCPKREERNGACEDLPLAVTVSSPGQGGYDVVEIAGSPPNRMQGRVHDCALDTGLLAIATGSDVVTIDVKTHRKTVVSKSGGDQVAINAAWLAWSDGLKVYVQHR